MIYLFLKIKKIEDEIPNITNLATAGAFNAKINEVKHEILTISFIIAYFRNDSLVLCLPAKTKKIFMLAKNSWKTEIKLFS